MLVDGRSLNEPVKFIHNVYRIVAIRFRAGLLKYFDASDTDEF